MADDDVVHIEGYALTCGPDDRGDWIERIDRAALERAVAENPAVPLRIGDRIVGQAQLSVDDTGLRVSADIEPHGARLAMVDEGEPVYDRVHDVAAPKLLERGAAVALNASYRVKDQQWTGLDNDQARAARQISQLSILDVSIAAQPAQERDDA